MTEILYKIIHLCISTEETWEREGGGHGPLHVIVVKVENRPITMPDPGVRFL